MAQRRLSSSSNPDIDGNDSIHLEDLNYASLVYPFHYKINMVVSLSYLKLYRFDKNLSTLVTRIDPIVDVEVVTNSEFDQDGTFSVIAPAFGIDVTDNLSLGITFNLWNNTMTGDSSYEIRQIFNITRIFSIDPDFPRESHLAREEEFEVEEGLSVVIGGMYRFNENWNLGVVIKPPFELDIDHQTTRTSGRLNTRTGEVLRDPVNKTKTDSELEFPLILGVGAAWRPMDPLTLSTDVTWTQWSDYVFSENGRQINPISGSSTDNGELDDTVTVRFGGEYLLLSEKYIIPLRFGFGYDPSPAIKDVDDFFTASLGGGIQIGKYNFDVAYEFRWGNNVNKDVIIGVDATQDIRQHRVLASLIYYF